MTGLVATIEAVKDVLQVPFVDVATVPHLQHSLGIPVIEIHGDLSSSFSVLDSVLDDVGDATLQQMLVSIIAEGGRVEQKADALLATQKGKPLPHIIHEIAGEKELWSDSHFRRLIATQLRQVPHQKFHPLQLCHQATNPFRGDGKHPIVHCFQLGLDGGDGSPQVVGNILHPLLPQRLFLLQLTLQHLGGSGDSFQL